MQVTDEMARLREAGEQIARLATGAIGHDFQGRCPSGPGDSARDPGCEACSVLDAWEAALSVGDTTGDESEGEDLAVVLQRDAFRVVEPGGRTWLTDRPEDIESVQADLTRTFVRLAPVGDGEPDAWSVETDRGRERLLGTFIEAQAVAEQEGGVPVGLYRHAAPVGVTSSDERRSMYSFEEMPATTGIPSSWSIMRRDPDGQKRTVLQDVSVDEWHRFTLTHADGAEETACVAAALGTEAPVPSSDEPEGELGSAPYDDGSQPMPVGSPVPVGDAEPVEPDFWICRSVNDDVDVAFGGERPPSLPAGWTSEAAYRRPVSSQDAETARLVAIGRDAEEFVGRVEASAVDLVLPAEGEPHDVLIRTALRAVGFVEGPHNWDLAERFFGAFREIHAVANRRLAGEDGDR